MLAVYSTMHHSAALLELLEGCIRHENNIFVRGHIRIWTYGLILALIWRSYPLGTMDQLLYAVRWDIGQTSKHYANDLFCIGRFETLEEFNAAIIPHEPVQLTLGLLMDELKKRNFCKATDNSGSIVLNQS